MRKKICILSLLFFLLFSQLNSYAVERDNLSLFVDAVYSGDIGRIRELRDSVDVNCNLPVAIKKTFEEKYPFLKFNDPVTPFSIAILKKDEKVVLELLRQGADAKKTSNMLVAAIMSKVDDSLIEILLKGKMDVNVMFNMEGASLLPISAAILFDRFEQLKILLNNGADPNIMDNLLLTPMHIATMKDRKYLDLLIEYGGDINVGTNFSKPVSTAASKGNIDMVKYLISKGADVDFIGDGNIFLIAAVDKNKKLAELAIKSGATNNGWNELLKWAILTKDTFFVELLLQNGYKLNDKYVYFSIAKSNIDVVKLLFEKYDAEFLIDYALALLDNLYCHEDEGIKIYEYFNGKRLLSLDSVYEGYTFEELINHTIDYNCTEWDKLHNKKVVTTTIFTKNNKLKLINRLKGFVYDSN